MSATAMSSPRRQMFELEVGDDKKPQRLLVTVETEDQQGTGPGSAARRRLFEPQNSTPLPMIRRMEKATTTTVPLRGSDDDEVSTPRRRGRPRKSVGTPLPSAGTKRRAGTPIKRTPRRLRAMSAADMEEEDALATNVQTTPKSTRRGRPPKKRLSEITNEVGGESARKTSAAVQSRQQRELEQEFTLVMEPTDSEQTQDTRPTEDAAAVVPTPVDMDMDDGLDHVGGGSNADAESDIWMATMDGEETPRAANRTSHSLGRSSPPVDTSEPLAPESEPLAPEPESDFSEAGDYGYLPAAASDASSVDEPLQDLTSRNNDTIAQGEDFSMILIPSLQSSFNGSSMQNTTHNEIGEETSMIIQNTIEELRRSRGERDAVEHGVEGEADEQQEKIETQVTTTTDVVGEDAEPETEEAPEQPPESIHEEEVTDQQEPSLPSLPRPNPTPIRGQFSSPMRVPRTMSPRFNLSPRWTQSPRRPVAAPLRQKLLRSKAEQAPTAIEEDVGHGTNDQSPTKLPQQVNSHESAEHSNMYDDSFSEIPERVLQAATPGRPTPIATSDELDEEMEEMEQSFQQGEVDDVVSDDEVNQDEQVEDEEAGDGNALPTASNTSAISRSDAGRLPTPDDTPPQVDFDELDDLVKSAPVSQPSSRVSSPVQPQAGTEAMEQLSKNGMEVEEDEEDDQLTPKPAVRVATYEVSENGHEGEEDEDSAYQRIPEIVEDTLEVSIEDTAEDIVNQITAESESAAEEAFSRRSMLSPGARLRQMEVTPANQLSSPAQDPQSLLPEAHLDKSLRPVLSPIVRAGRALQSVTSDPPSPEGREQQLRSPFRSSVSRDSRPASQDNQGGQRFSLSPRRPFSFPPAQPSQAFDDPFGAGSRHNGQPGFMEALNRSAGNVNFPAQQSRASSKDSPVSSMRIAPPSEGEMSWIANEGPISAHLRGDNLLKDLAGPPVTKPAKSAIFRAMADTRPARIEPEANELPQEQDDDDMDIWEFEAQRESSPATRNQSQARPAPVPAQRRNALPSPWTKRGTQNTMTTSATSGSLTKDTEAMPEPEQGREPDDELMDASGPESEEANEFSMVAQEKGQGQNDKAPGSAKAKRFDLSSFFSSPASIPGMLADKLLPGKTRSLFGAQSNERDPEPEMAEAAPVMPTSSMFPQVPQKEFRPTTDSRTDLFSPARANKSQQETASLEASLPSTPERTELPTVAQKKDFTPRPRQTRTQDNNEFFQASASRSTVPTPPRMQLSHADIERWQQETSNASEDSSSTSNTRLRPLPPRGASPSKSSLRSPLKPRTPGRVVEFTSSVLSPIEQARVRQERRLSSASASQLNNNNNKVSASQGNSSNIEDKENHGNSGSKMSDASVVSEQPFLEDLSQTVWTRNHWLFLDELLQLRRQGPFEEGYERRADKFLGKTVKSQGEAMRLERWHLDCVDAFKAEVGGWDEGVLAKRLFALILGEERRSRGVVDRPRRVIFH